MLCDVPDDIWMHRLALHGIAARALLEQAWSPETAYQGITLGAEDVAARGQCGVTSLWFANYLERQGEEAYFVDGTIEIDGYVGEHVWAEAVRPAAGACMIDLTSNQYRTVHGTSVAVTQYGDFNGNGVYTPKQRFKPADVPHGKLRHRYAILEANIAGLSRRQRNKPRKTYL